jgi:ABC-type multidrug transport system fused ATPase/permease subunit
MHTQVELHETTAQQLLSARWYSWWRSLASSIQTTLPLLCTAAAVRYTHRSSSSTSSSSTTTASSHSSIDLVSGIMAFLTLCALRHTLAEWPTAVKQLLAAARAMQRLQQFLLVQEVAVVSGAALITAGVSLDCCTFVWDAPTLMAVLNASTVTATAAAATTAAADAVQRELELTRAQLREADRAMLLVSVNTPTHGKPRTPSRAYSNTNSSNTSSSFVHGAISSSVTADSSRGLRAGSSAPQRRQLKGHRKSISWTPNSTSLAAIARAAGSSDAVIDDCYSTDSDSSFSRSDAISGSATIAAAALFSGNGSNHYTNSNCGSNDSSSHPSTPTASMLNGTHTTTFNTPTATTPNGSSANFSSSSSSAIAAIPAYIRTVSTLPTPLSPVVSEGRGSLGSCADCSVESSAESSAVGGESILALSRVTLEVGLGQFVGIVGPRKSGKTTLLAAVLGEARR